MTDEALDDPRIVKTERLWPRKTGYHVELRSPDDVDVRLLGWLKRAYEMGN